MGSSELAEVAEHLRDHPGSHWQQQALALALAERAQHIARSSKSLEGDNGIWCLRDIVRKLGSSTLLDEESASKFLRFFDNRVKLLMHANHGHAKAHDLSSGISGQPLLQRAQHVDLIGRRLENSAADLQSRTRLLQKSGLLEDEESEDYLHYFDNRITELQQCALVKRMQHDAGHNGLSWQDLRKGVHRLQGTCEGLKKSTYRLRSSLQFLHSLGFSTDEEAEEHFCYLDEKMSEICAQAVHLSNDVCGGRPRSSLLP
jgi:hypothetical protein